MTTPWDSFIGNIERRKQQLDDVLDAYRVFQDKVALLPADLVQEAGIRLAIVSPPENGPLFNGLVAEGDEVDRDLAGKSSLDCAQIILTENGNEPMHYGAIAKEMLRRGYEGRKSGTPEEVELRTQQSLWAALSRSENFKGIGKGRYTLKHRESAQ